MIRTFLDRPPTNETLVVTEFLDALAEQREERRAHRWRRRRSTLLMAAGISILLALCGWAATAALEHLAQWRPPR